MGVTVGRWEMYVLRARTLVVGTRKPCGNAHSRRRPPPLPRGAFENFKLSQKFAKSTYCSILEWSIILSLRATDNRQPTTHGHLPPPLPLSFFLRTRPLPLPQ